MTAQAQTLVPILVVDDEPLNRELLRRVLNRDYDVHEAEDAEEALALIQKQDPAFRVVLCDQLMPGKSGTDLAEEVYGKYPHMSFLLITGYDDDPQVRDARAKGQVREVVTKPWTARGLKELISSLLAG